MKRGCGNLVPGGAYASVPKAEGGLPIEHYLADEMIGINPYDVGLSAMGMTPFESDGVTHLFDWVGSKYYHFPADFIEEARLLGISRRMSKNLPWDKFTEESRLLLVHQRGGIANVEEIRESELSNLTVHGGRCPKYKCSCAADTKIMGEHEVSGYNGSCAALHWHMPDGSYFFKDAQSYRDQPETSIRYKVAPQIIPFVYSPAIFMISQFNIFVYRDEVDNTHEGMLTRVRSAKNIDIQLKDIEF